jgi:hypothetical protein
MVLQSVRPDFEPGTSNNYRKIPYGGSREFETLSREFWRPSREIRGETRKPEKRESIHAD